MTSARVFALAACLAGAFPAAAGQGLPEYDVKAAFLLNFTRYVEWPDSRRTPPFQMCLFRNDPFESQLEAALAGERWNGGEMVVRVVTNAADAASCHLLYVPEAAEGRFAAQAQALASRPVLVVGEHDQVLQQGGMIRLFVDQRRVRFSINQKAAAASGLQISSRLLRLAQTIVPSS